MKKEICAGILFVTQDGKALFLERSDHGDYEGFWGLPGGHQKRNESLIDAAIRETFEETKYKIDETKLIHINRQLSTVEGDEHDETREIDYTTFLCIVDEEFQPELNKEHTSFIWAPIDAPGKTLHPGLIITLQKLQADELGIAKMMAAGDLPSPQKYMNLILFNMRITGTGLAYRSGLDEFVWRDNSIYLNDEFLQRCNGLPVIFEHPKGATLNTKEYVERNIGSVFLPYIKNDEVWAIAKIWDIYAAKIMEENQLSTSPAVVLYGGDEKRELNGKTLLIEGKPRLLDHLAICYAGVWDKSKPPLGVSTIIPERELVMADEDDRAASLAAHQRSDADAGQTLDKTLKCLDSITSRMDAFEESEKEREKARTDRKAKKDAKRADKQAKKDAQVKADADKAKADADKAKKDAEEAEEKKRADAEEEVRKRIADVEQRLPKQMTDADYAAMADAQVTADKIFLMHGKRAPRPLDGQTLIAYRRFLASSLKEHSAAWKAIDLNVIADDVAFSNVEKTIYADALQAGLNPVSPSEDFLMEIIKEDVTGRKISEFVGKPTAWMNQFTQPKRMLVGIRNSN